MKIKQTGFTIVELLIVIVVIAILAAISIVAYNGIQERAKSSAREADANLYYKAILAARINTGQRLRDITTSSWSLGYCTSSTYNPEGEEPANLPKTHICWTSFYDNLTNIGTAADMNLDSLREGDANGNPYVLDENEGENCSPDVLSYFAGDGVERVLLQRIPRTAEC